MTVVKKQGIFLKHFNIAHHRKDSCHNTIQLCVEKFRMNASALTKKLLGSVCVCSVCVHSAIATGH
jgi:hypothetical protein